jgi:hypothetical protein
VLASGPSKPSRKRKRCGGRSGKRRRRPFLDRMLDLMMGKTPIWPA